MMYKNLFPPKYGKFEENEYDRVDYLKPHERKPHKYRLLANPSGGDIDRTRGYNSQANTVSPNFKLIRNPTHAVQITWIRHSSFLIQLGGKYQCLVDPVLAPFDGLAGKMIPYTEVGAANVTPPILVQDLQNGNEVEPGSHRHNRVNLVVISHDHYDHLNFNTLEELPAETIYYVPLGLESRFPSRYPIVTGMDWYTHDNLDELKITFLPATHHSGIARHEKNQTLWGGWLLEWNGYRVYYAGDTGSSDVFKDIQSRLGEMDICVLPIGTWYPRSWHLAPEDAIDAAQQLGCKVLIPSHWGSWIMSYEHMLEPPRRLQYAWDKIGPKNMALRVLKMGETYAAGSLDGLANKNF